MTRRILIFICLLPAIFLPAVLTEAQQPKKVPRIGYLTGATPEGQSTRIDAFRQGLRELGYVEAKNIIIEFRYAEENFDRIPALAADLVRLKRRRYSHSWFKYHPCRQEGDWNHPHRHGAG
jgi:hypothetical protein